MPKKLQCRDLGDPELVAAIDEVAEAYVSQVSPREMGLLKYPFAEPVKMKRVSVDVIDDHLTRYTKAELKRGQFFRVGGKYTFFMDHQTKAKREAGHLQPAGLGKDRVG